MAIFHVKVSTVKRSGGRSAVAASAYRSGKELVDERTGLTANYSRRRGVKAAFLVLPRGAPKWANNRNELWNRVEAAERRKNSTVAREWLVALPAELDDAGRRRLAEKMAGELVERYGVAVDVAIHVADKRGDQRNYHAHLLTSTRELLPDGFGAKTRVLDAAKTGGVEIQKMRDFWADAVNAELAAAGVSAVAFVDHRPKSVQAEAARGVADRLEKRAEAMEALSGRAGSLSDVLRGAKAALRDPGALWASSGPQEASQARAEAREWAARAEVLEMPLNQNHGVVATAIMRNERDAEAKRAREKAAQEAKQKAAMKAAEEKRSLERWQEKQLGLEIEQKFLRELDLFPTPRQRRGVGLTFNFKAVAALFEAGGISAGSHQIRAVMSNVAAKWLERISAHIADLKPARNLFEALTGGDAEAAQTLSECVEASAGGEGDLTRRVAELSKIYGRRLEQGAEPKAEPAPSPPSPRGPSFDM